MGVYSTPPLDFFKNEEPKGRVFLEAMMQSAQIWLYIWGIFATLFLIAIFLFPPLELKETLTPNFDKPLSLFDGGKLEEKPAFLLLMQELEKAEKEIRLHQHQEDDWFHNKFLLIGVLVLGFAMNILTPYSNRHYWKCLWISAVTH